MKKFNVLPTEERWKTMTNDQIEWILYNMEKDVEMEERARKGKALDADYEDYDGSWYDASHEEFNPVRDGHDEEEIARKLAEITTEEDMARLKARWEASQEVDDIRAKGGTTIEEDTINELIANKLQKAIEEAKRIESHGGDKWGEKTPIELEEEQANQQFKAKLEQDDIQDAIALFEGNTELPSQDDDFEI